MPEGLIYVLCFFIGMVLWDLTKALFRLAARALGDPCEQLSDERTYGDNPTLPRDFVGERISHSPNTTSEGQ